MAAEVTTILRTQHISFGQSGFIHENFYLASSTSLVYSSRLHSLRHFVEVLEQVDLHAQAAKVAAPFKQLFNVDFAKDLVGRCVH